MILAGCGTDPPEGYDWCKIYDFTALDYGFNITAGSQVDEIGLITELGLLQFSYEYPQFVAPNAIIVTVLRPDGIVGDINIQAAGTIYGVGASLQVSMPTDEETVVFTPATIGDAGTQVNVTIDVGTQELIISQLEVRGLGATPFDENPCSQVTPTTTLSPTPNTPPPTNTQDPLITWTPTNTPTPTETPTETPTPTDTPTGCANVTSTAITVTDFSGVISATQGSPCIAGDNIKLWTFDPTAPDTETLSGGNALIFERHTSGANGVNSSGILYVEFPRAASVSNVAITFSASISPDQVKNVKLIDTYRSAISFADRTNNRDSVGSITWVGTGSNALSASVAHNSIVWYEMRAYAQTNTGSSGSYVITNTITSMVITYSFDTVASPTPSPTGSPTLTRTPISTPFPGTGTRTPIGYNSPTPPPTVNLTTTAATATGTPSVTNTAYPTYTYIPSYTPQSTYTAIPGTAENEWDAENEAEYQILGQQADFFSWLQNVLANLFGFLASVFNAILNAIAGFFRLIADIINFILSLITAIINFVIELLGIILLIVNLILGLIGLMLAYIAQAIARLIALITAFFTAPATPIPGLPQCISAPLSHDICAIYYIMDWTIFEPQTAGTFIIPLVLTMMNVIILFRFVKYVLNIVRKGEDATTF